MTSTLAPPEPRTTRIPRTRPMQLRAAVDDADSIAFDGDARQAYVHLRGEVLRMADEMEAARRRPEPATRDEKLVEQTQPMRLPDTTPPTPTPRMVPATPAASENPATDTTRTAEGTVPRHTKAPLEQTQPDLLRPGRHRAPDARWWHVPTVIAVVTGIVVLVLAMLLCSDSPSRPASLPAANSTLAPPPFVAAAQLLPGGDGDAGPGGFTPGRNNTWSTDFSRSQPSRALSLSPVAASRPPHHRHTHRRHIRPRSQRRSLPIRRLSPPRPPVRAWWVLSPVR